MTTFNNNEFTIIKNLNLYRNIGVFCLYTHKKGWNKQTKGISNVFDILIYNQYNCIHMETKVCKGCNNTKPTNEFYGGRNKCIVCYRKERNEHREKNKDSINEKGREYYYSNHDKMLEKRKNYREGENKERVSNYNKEYLKTYEKNRVKSDKLYEIRRTIRNVIKGSLYKKGYTENSKTYKILGCEYDEFIKHIESQWEEWMNWDNYGLYNGEKNYGWDLYHTVPVSTGKSEEEIIKLNHYSNIQPLCSYVNRYIKKNKII